MADESAEGPGRYAFEGLDRLIHEKARLGILSSLLNHRPGLTFNQLRDLCALTDGNLSRHLSTLEEAGLVELAKDQKCRRPQTRVVLTERGRERFLNYLSVLEQIVRATLHESKVPLNDGLGWTPLT